jgi:tetratricopeptide (TPR) repeat protein
MAPESEDEGPVPTDPSRRERLIGLLGRHKLIGIGSVVVVAALVAGGVGVALRSGGSSSPKAAAPPASKNAVIASYQKQLPALEAAVSKTPGDAHALDSYGVALYATGDVAKARVQYEAELKVNGSDAVLLNNLGNVYRDLGSYDKARASYQKSISIAPKSATAYINLANLYTYTLREHALGVSTILQAQRALPTNPDLGVLLGIAYEESGNKVDARAAFEAVLKKTPTSVAAKAGMARVGTK